MKLNGSKRNESHHIPCLSGLSQAPLIGDNTSERMTPISAHTLTLQSPTRISHQQSLCSAHQMLNKSNASARANLPNSNLFFPPLPSRSSSSSASTPSAANRSHMTLNPIGLPSNTNNDSHTSAKLSDFNMNFENERNREKAHTQADTAQPTPRASQMNANLKFFGPSQPSTPLQSSAKAFKGFFPESQSQQLGQSWQNSLQSPLTPTIKFGEANGNISSEMSCGGEIWPHQDENYHLYHEPTDLDDENDSTHKTIEQLKRKNVQDRANTAQQSPLATVDNDAHQTSPPPPPPAPRPSSIAATLSQMSDRVASTLTAINIEGNNKSSTAAKNAHNKTNLSFTERANNEPKQNSDVSADVYFRYVTLKSTERTNHLSRSYHGPKNNINNHNDGSHTREHFASTLGSSTMKNLSSTSVAELTMAPSVFPSSLTMPLQLGDHCVRELIVTESNYVHALGMIITCFAKPLELLLKREENQLIFGHIKYFHSVHSSLQAELKKAASKHFNKELQKSSSTRRGLHPQNNEKTVSHPSTPTTPGNVTIKQASPIASPTLLTINGRGLCISACFLNVREKFLKYGEYCATLSKAQALLDELANKNDVICAQLERCQQEANEGRFKLRDLLSLPMQRILKYHLLLAQLIKNTNSNDEEYQGLKRAHETLVDLGQYINEVKRDTEAMQILDDIEQTMIGLNFPRDTKLTDYGRLITDGAIKIKVPQESKPTKSTHELAKLKSPQESKIKQRYVFVFDKVILMCKDSGLRGSYQYKEALVLEGCSLEVNPFNTCDTMSKHAPKDKYSYVFNLIRDADSAVYSFHPKSQEMKNKWVNAIQKAMDNIKPSACRNVNHKFQMHTFQRASSCDHCGKLLLGLYYQGYRCGVCFTSVHKKCISNVRPCGPALPPKPGVIRSSGRSHACTTNEPPSPSMRSNCSDNGNPSMQLPHSSSSSTHCLDAAVLKVEYSNLKGRLDNLTSSSFRKANLGKAAQQQRPASSMINVSLQNSVNHQQKQTLRESNSTPAISRRLSPKVRALTDFDGNEDSGELRMSRGDTILLYKNAIQMVDANETGGSDHLSQLQFNQNNDDTSKRSWWFGRNLRSGSVGRFPSEVVEVLDPDDNLINTNLEELVENDALYSEQINRYVNFVLDDRPWFCGRMERDKAQALLEKMPHETFLVRVSPKHNGSYVISLNYNSQVKHMRINISKDNQLYLSENRYFRSVIELVSWYERNSLVESFHMLDARLSRPFKLCS